MLAASAQSDSLQSKWNSEEVILCASICLPPVMSISYMCRSRYAERFAPASLKHHRLADGMPMATCILGCCHRT